jgi:cytochrome c556
MRTRISLITLILVALTVGIWAASNAEAQETPQERRRAILEGVLRSFVEPHIEDGNLNLGPVQIQDPTVDPNVQPGHDHDHEPVNVDQSSDLVTSVNSFSGDLNRLIEDLFDEARRSPSLRSLLADALQLQSTVDFLGRQFQAADNQAVLIQTAETLDQQWRSLAHQLQQAGPLDGPTRTRIQRMTNNAEAIRRLLNVAPQLDELQIFYKLIEHSSILNALLEDVELDVPNQNVRSELLLEGRPILFESNLIAEQMQSGQVGTETDLTARYVELNQLWHQFAQKIRPYGGESLQRNTLRVERLHKDLHELFLIPIQFDREQIAELAELLVRETTACRSSITVDILLQTASPAETAGSLQRLSARASAFRTTVNRNSSQDDLVASFLTVDSEWQKTLGFFSGNAPNTTPTTPTVLAEVGAVMEALRAVLQVRAPLDMRVVTELASETDELSYALFQTLTQIAANTRNYPSRTRSTILSQGEAFHEAAHELHDDLTNEADLDDLSRRCIALSETWAPLADTINQLNTHDAAACYQYAERIVPAVTELQLLLAY